MADSQKQLCRNCKEEIFGNYYICKECATPFQQCEQCFLELSETSNRHAHKLYRTSTASKPRLLFEFVDDKSSEKHTLYLSNIDAALPSSKILKEKQINSVISIVQAAELSADYKAMTDLYSAASTGDIIYAEGLDTIVQDTDSKVLYYNLNMADISNPAILEKPAPGQPSMKAAEVFCRYAIFIEGALRRGNVLVHCEQGRRRSPTAIVAFLVSRGVSPFDAITTIGATYRGDEAEDWAPKYRKHRSMWIGALGSWKEKSRSEILSFKLDHPRLCKALIGMKWTEADAAAVEAERKSHQQSQEARTGKTEIKRSLASSASSSTATASTAPVSKKFKVATTSIGPALWNKTKKK